MSDNVKVLLVGAGVMAEEYCKVLTALNYEPIIVGRGEDKAAKFEKATGLSVLRGGIEENIKKMDKIPEYAIIAAGIFDLADITKTLLNHNIKSILVEKPAGVNRKQIEEITTLAKEKGAKVYVAYNRRFYASTSKALEIIEEDGGVTSFNFEFTEWANISSKKVNEIRFLANSTHVVDLAFFLGGCPVEMSSYVQGELDWHKSGCIYAGAGISDKDALFSYQANWDAPGRWSVEILTNKHRLYFKPMEKLQIQEKGSVEVKLTKLDDSLDIVYKPGLYRQVESFLNKLDDGKKITIEEQLMHMKWYEMIEGMSI